MPKQEAVIVSVTSATEMTPAPAAAPSGRAEGLLLLPGLSP